MSFSSSLGIINLAIKHRSSQVKIIYHRKNYELVQLLYKLGYLNSYTMENNMIYLFFKYYNNELVINKLFFYSKPGSIKSISISELRRAYYKKNKLFILSTTYGICSTMEALQFNLGGIIIAEIT